VPASELVPGDVIIIEEGDTIPADSRLIESASLQTSEAALTGESMPVTKETAAIANEVPLGDRDNMVFSGTAATYGHGKAVVTATGMRSEMGRIAGLLKDTPDESTPLQRELDHTGKVLGIVVVAIAVAMIVTIVVVENVRGAAALFEVLILGVALAVAAVPEGLPAVVTAVLSIGVQRMARRNAIIRHLAAVETLGSATVIASDKTGTLTKNEMTVRVAVTASGRVNFLCACRAECFHHRRSVRHSRRWSHSVHDPEPMLWLSERGSAGWDHAGRLPEMVCGSIQPGPDSAVPATGGAPCGLRPDAVRGARRWPTAV
jgi:P-type Ca2+ transporter type 2C